jgi:hypothetical protein
MGHHDHLEMEPREELVEYCAYLESDADERPLAVKIDDLPTYQWLETALAGDEEPLSEEAVRSLDSLIGEDPEGWSWAEGGRQLAAYCRQVLHDFDQ